MTYDCSNLWKRYYSKEKYDRMKIEHLKNPRFPIPTSIAEIGVGKGDFTKLLIEAFPEAELHLFDLWTERARVDEDIIVDHSILDESDYADDYEQRNGAGNVEDQSPSPLGWGSNLNFPKTLVGKDNIHKYKGDVCITSRFISKDVIFDLAFINVNAYRSTLHSLKFCWDHLSDSGRIYLYNTDGLYTCKKALDDFLAETADVKHVFLKTLEVDMIGKKS